MRRSTVEVRVEVLPVALADLGIERAESGRIAIALAEKVDPREALVQREVDLREADLAHLEVAVDSDLRGG